MTASTRSSATTRSPIVRATRVGILAHVLLIVLFALSTRELAARTDASAVAGARDIAADDDGTRLPVPGVGVEPQPGAILPLETELVRHDGELVRLGDAFDGKPAVLAFVYFRCPVLCNLVLDNLVRSLRDVSLVPGKDFRVLAVSIDPADDPAKARKKRADSIARYGGDVEEDGWWFLTGSDENVRALADRAGFRYRRNPRTGQYDHPAVVMVLTPAGALARYHYGIDYPPRDLRLSLIDAAQERIGSVADQVLLLCLAWDPQAGRYTAAIWRILTVACGATVVGVAGLIIFLRKRPDPLPAQALDVDKP